MKNFFLNAVISLVLLAGSTTLFAQISEGGIPPSFSELKSSESIDFVTIAPPDMAAIMQEDMQDEKNGTMYKVARLLDVSLNMENAGTWDNLEDGTPVWRLHLQSRGAKGMALHFDGFNIPDGAKFFVYTPDHSMVLGAFTSYNNSGSNATSIGMLPGEDLILEYVAPRANSKTFGFKKVTEPEIQIGNVSYFYRGMELFGFGSKGTGFGASESCEVNINCSEGTNWQIQKKGVARIYTVAGGYGGYCTGTLVNNTANNGTPYFLTADHCGGGEASTSEFNQWVFYFNFEASGCTNPGSSPSSNSMTGCSKKARSPMNGGSDFLLLQLNSTPPANYGVIYNGWNRANTGSPSGASIHHPAGDIKKISTYTSTLTQATYNGGTGSIGATNAHWRVVWAATANGHGVTEPGSSGSPIFDNNGRVVGTLSGGSSYCDATSSPDLYGKFYYHWDQYGSTNADKLKPWLDPQGTNPTTLDYYNPNSTTLNANFTASPTTVTAGGTVNFTNTSTGSPTSYSWSFPGGTPSTSTATNPSIVYNTVGTYNVSLTATSGSGSDTETKTGYITVTAQGSGFSLDFESCTDFQVDGFTPWTTYDGDASGTYAINGVTFTNQNYTGSWIAFNQSATTPAAGTQWAAHGGSRCGICFAATTPPNNDWLISPQLTMQSNGSITFWAKSATDQYGLEVFNVKVSTTNGTYSSFTTTLPSASNVQAPTEWTQYTYSLSAYNGQNIYIAIQCVSNDAFGFMIDDIVINTGTAAGTAPVANFVGNPTSVTAGGTVAFTDQSTNSPTSWSWSFPGAATTTSSSQNPSIVYNTPGTYNVSLTVTNAYGNDSEVKNGYITVTQASTGFSLDFEACTDFQVDGFTPWTTYDGDGSGTYSINGVTFTNQNYTGSWIAFNQTATTPAAGTEWAAHGGSRCGICFAATTPPNNDWLISPQLSMQSNGSITFWAKSATDQYGLEVFNVKVSTTNGTYSSFTTTLPSGSNVQAPTTWTQYTFPLTAYNGQNIYIAIQCVSNDAFGFMIDDIVINTGTASGTAPVANFVGNPTTVTAGGTVAFTDQSTNSPTSWSWSFPGAATTTSSSQNPSIVYNTPGTYNVSLTVTNAYGNDSEVKNGYITVTAAGNAPVANFSGNPTTVGAGGTVSFTDLSTNSPTSWSWSFPGAATTTSSSQNPSIVYNTPGTYNVSLTVTNAYGNDSEVKNGYITVTQQGGTAPNANFVGNPTTVSAGGTVAFTDLSTNTPTSWSWSFPGAATTSSSAQNPSIVYNTPGTYNVSLTVTNAYGNDSEVKIGYITVTQQSGNAPVADFVGNPTWLVAGNSVSFTDLSTNSPTSWSWYFPGSSTTNSSQQNPTIVYSTPGTYNVFLTVTNAYGSNSVAKHSYVTVVPPVTNFSLDFEDCTDFQVDNFDPWTTFDGDGVGVNNVTGTVFINQDYIGSWIAFNNDLTAPAAPAEYAPHGGDRCGICMPVTGTNNDWLISPQITLGSNAEFSFWAKSVSYMAVSNFKVLISTTNTNPASFVPISAGQSVMAPTVWNQFTYNLNAYNGQTVYVAIQCNASGHYGLMLDDINLVSATAISHESFSGIKLYPNPNEGNFVIDAGDFDGNLNVNVMSLNGQLMNVETQRSGNLIYIDLGNVADGMYFVRVSNGQSLKTFKVSVLK
ncbi:MAG TPA: PKD domain-containing protein [Bacteroidales bacterium]|mgnify:CR=1 FL=1|nr:PKD domain-containing protein [Bacteroidales bacterium]